MTAGKPEYRKEIEHSDTWLTINWAPVNNSWFFLVTPPEGTEAYVAWKSEGDTPTPVGLDNWVCGESADAFLAQGQRHGWSNE